MAINREAASLETLQEQIRTARERMHCLWDERGTTDSEVLSASIELDILLNEYQRRVGYGVAGPVRGVREGLSRAGQLSGRTGDVSEKS